MDGIPRTHFAEDLERVQGLIADMGSLAESMVPAAVSSLIDRDAGGAQQVIDDDDRMDALYLEVEELWMKILATQAPVAGDLRLMSVVLHLNKTLERMGDQAVNVAKLGSLTEDLPTKDSILTHIQEMGDAVLPMIGVAMDAFIERDLDKALSLPEMDDPVDRLNRVMYKEVAACGGDQQLLEWAVRMMLVARALERVGDQSVDIGEQVAFLLTGEFRELDED